MPIAVCGKCDGLHGTARAPSPTSTRGTVNWAVDVAGPAMFAPATVGASATVARATATRAARAPRQGVRMRTSAATRTASAQQASRFRGDLTLLRPNAVVAGRISLHDCV